MSFFPEEKNNLFSKIGSAVSNAFHPPVDPKEAVRKWTGQIRTESRRTDRSIREITLAQTKAHRQIKAYAKHGDMAAAKIVAKECINSQKAINRLHMQKAHFLDMECALKEQLAMVRVAGALQQSAQVMTIVSDLMKIPALQQTMMEMSREMAKAGLIEEMVNESIEDAMDTEGLEDASEAEVNKILLEIAGETAAQLPAPSATVVPTPEEVAAEDKWMEDVAAGRDPSAPVAVAEGDDDLADRLRALAA